MSGTDSMTCGDNKLHKIKSPKEKYKTGAERTRTLKQNS